MIGSGDGDALVAKFYASATGECSWSTTLEHLASLFHSSATLFAIHRPKSMDVLAIRSHNYSDEFLKSFFQGEIYSNDPRVPPINDVPPGSIYYDAMLYDIGAIEADPWVRASIDALGVADQMGAKLRLPEGGVATLGLLRTRQQGRVTDEAVRAFARLVPRIEGACSLGYLIERDVAVRDVLLDLLAPKADGIVLLDRLGRLAFANEAAERLFRSSDGLALRNGALVARRPPESRRLDSLIRAAVAGADFAGGAGGRMLVSKVSGERPYAVCVTQAPRREAFLAGRTIAVVVQIHDLAVPRVPEAETLRAMFGLTQRESQLAVELVRLARLDRAAARCGMAVNTARNRLQSIFMKSGASSQTEAVQMFAELP